MQDVLTGDDQGARDPGRASRSRTASTASVSTTSCSSRSPRPPSSRSMLGLTRDEIINAVSLAWVDGQSLRTYRHAPNTGSRKSWAAGDATSRAVRLALIAKTGEMGYPSVLTAKTWGFYDVLFKGAAVQVPAPVRQLRDGERAVQDQLSGGIPRADRGRMRDAAAPAGRRPARRHPADHDPHARVGDPHHRQEGPARQSGRPRPLHPVHGRGAADPRPPDRRRLRGQRRRRSRASTRCASKMVCVEDPAVLAATTSIPTSARSPTRSPSSSTTARSTQEVVVEYPIGHRRRRKEGIPVLIEKFQTNLARRFAGQAAAGDPRRRARRAAARRDAGARVRRPVRHLSIAAAVQHASRRRCAASLSALASPALRSPPRVRAGAPRTFRSCKSGLWEIRPSPAAPTASASTSRMCLDDAMQKQMYRHGRRHARCRDMCSKHDMQPPATACTVDVVCNIGGSTDALRTSVMTVNGDTAYRTEINATYDPPFMGMTESKTVLDGEHGSAPASPASSPATWSCRTARRSTCATRWAHQRRTP